MPYLNNSSLDRRCYTTTNNRRNFKRKSAPEAPWPRVNICRKRSLLQSIITVREERSFGRASWGEVGKAKQPQTPPGSEHKRVLSVTKPCGHLKYTKRKQFWVHTTNPPKQNLPLEIYTTENHQLTVQLDGPGPLLDSTLESHLYSFTKS